MISTSPVPYEPHVYVYKYPSLSLRSEPGLSTPGPSIPRLFCPKLTLCYSNFKLNNSE